MEHHPEPSVYLEKVLNINQAIFYCYNEAGERFPVNAIKGFIFCDENTLQFKTNFFPVIGQTWNNFAAELHFYKKGIPYSLKAEGVAIIDSTQFGLVTFAIKQVEYFDANADTDKSLLGTLFKPYMYVYRKSSELLMHTFKKTLAH
ncbi:MAG TPA: hypothetical protein PKM63_07880 [Panacibacter sp.]|nr:hypothetical protein [Panacibacter sp.]HNP44185.1 hypothetical protein [Panacibacter sp.]